MHFNYKTALYFVVGLGFAFGGVLDAYASSISPESIYNQARLKNEKYLNLLKRYPNIINTENKNGDTAYCLALKDGDKELTKLLKKYGANAKHECVKKVSKNEKIAKKEKKLKKENKKFAKKDVKRARFKSDNDTTPYWMWGLGTVAVAGGVASLSGGGGGGSGGSDFNMPFEDTYKGDGTAAGFETNEYKKANFLSLINASKAYAHIYKKDENGYLKSHQANSDNPLEKVRVGVIDNGFANNEELRGNIVKGYDINRYNNDRDLYGYDAGDIKLYFYKENDIFYALSVENGDLHNLTYTINGEAVDITKDNIERAVLVLAEEYNMNFDFDDFKIINKGDGYAPGVDDFLINIDPWINGGYKVMEIDHGTHVAGIIAGRKDEKGMHGVAFENAEIVGASWDMMQDIFPTVKKMVDEDNVKVISNSWGIPVEEGLDIGDAQELIYGYEDSVKSFAYAASKGAVWVQATGNDGSYQPSIHAGLNTLDLSEYGFSGDKEYEVSYVAVTALGTNGKIASYANRCGDARDWCIAAPGTEIVSSNTINGHVTMSGTSMATPVVSGSIALLQGYYPWLNTKNIAYLLLETANDSGVYADRSTYGKGALDLEAAVTTPVGDLGLPEESDLSSLKSVGLTRLATSDVVQNKLLKAMPKTITAYDALKRPFEYETAKLIKTTHGSSANLRNDVSRIAMADSGVKTIRDDKTGFMFRSSQSLNNEGNYHLSTAEVVNESESGATRFYYAENSNYINNDDALKSDNNPYLSMRNAYGVENSLNLSDTSKLKLSMQIGENGLFNRDEDLDKHNFDERAYSVGAEYSFNLTDYLELSTLGGMLFEEDAMLGLNGEGGFNVNDSSTYYMGLSAKLNLTNNISLLAAYYRGYTSGFDSNMLSISDLETESFMLAGEYNLNASDKVGLMLSSPMSVAKGSASMTYSTGRDNYSNSAYLNKIKTSLRPEAKEYDLGMYFKSKPSDNVSLSGKFETRFNADGKKGVEDYVGVVGAHIKW